MKKGISFTIEVLLLLAVLLASGSLLARTYGAAHTMSRTAQELTTAVQLAQNAAELFSAGMAQPSPQPFACYDAKKKELPAESSGIAYAVYLLENGQSADGVQQVRVIVKRFCADEAEELYRLETAKYNF